MRTVVTLGVVVVLGVGMGGCGGYGNGNSSGNSGNPTGPTPSGPNIVTVDVVAINGAQSFSPNPATLPAGQMIVWHNVDNVTHHVVLEDGSVDTGNLTPGSYSHPVTIEAGGGPYHCSIHPVMTGTIKQGQ
jgi:plastocyanin